MFPVSILALIATPMTMFNARALASLATAAGNALSKRLTVILNALVKVLEEEKDDEILAVDEVLACVIWINRGSRRVEQVNATTSWLVRAFGPDEVFFSDLRFAGRKSDAPRSIFHHLRGVRARFISVPRGLGATTDLLV